MADSLLDGFGAFLKDKYMNRMANQHGYDLKDPKSIRQLQIDEMALRSLNNRGNIFNPAKSGNENPYNAEGAQAPRSLGEQWTSDAKLQALQALLSHSNTPMMPDAGADLSPPSNEQAWLRSK